MNKPTTKAIEASYESNIQVKALEEMNKNGVFLSNSVKPIVKLLVPTNKSQFRLYDDPDSDNWNDYVMNVEKRTKYNDNLVFKISGKIFTLGGDVLKKITEYRINTTDSTDEKRIIDIMDEMHFDIQFRDKSLRDTNLIKKILIKEIN